MEVVDQDVKSSSQRGRKDTISHIANPALVEMSGVGAERLRLSGNDDPKLRYGQIRPHDRANSVTSVTWVAGMIYRSASGTT